jgi:outer membrane immunogenic protein
MKSLVIVASAASALAFAMPAAAQIASAEPEHTGAYGELGYTNTDIHGADNSVVTGRVGWRFNRFLGVEGELGLGISGGDRTFAEGTSTERDVNIKQKTNEAAYAVGYLPLSPRADLFARVGYGAAQYKVNPAGLPDYDAHSDGFKYGVGGQYFFDGQNGVRLDWTRYDIQSLHEPVGYFGGEHANSEWSVAFTHRF